jgi:hypothetical protein
VSLESWSSPLNRELRSEGSASLPHSGALGVIEGSSGWGILSGLLSSRRGKDLQGQFLVQRRYTEDWVLHRGYQQHRRTSPSWYSESSEDQQESGDQILEESLAPGRHRRNISNAKTITPADYQPPPAQSSTFLGVEPSSDRESGISGVTGVTGRYRTAPQSLVEFPMDFLVDASKMPSRWADLTPSPVEDKGLKLDVSTHLEPQPQQNTNDAVSTYLLSAPAPKSETTTRTNSPNSKKLKKWQGRNVFIQIPVETPFGLPEEEGGRPMPLSKAEVEHRMKAWRSQGYSLDIGGEGDCREVFPPEQKENVDASEIFVSIPDRRGKSFHCIKATVGSVKWTSTDDLFKDWEAYVTQLREEKLRALGVILDDEPPAQPMSVGGRGDTPLVCIEQSTPQYCSNISRSRTWPVLLPIRFLPLHRQALP